MKKILKKEVIIAFIFGVIIAGGVVYAATSASQITYKNGKTVEQALNELYNKTDRTPQQVATLTTQGASYTFQNDGYIFGTANRSSNKAMAKIFLGSKELAVSNWDEDKNYDVSIYVTSGTVVSTRSDGGTYNLICYEFK